MKKVFSILFLLILTFGFSQKIKTEFLEINNNIQAKKEKSDFFFVNENTDLSSTQYIGKIRCVSKIPILSILIDEVKFYAQKKGANAFTYESFKKSTNESELVLKVYIIDDKIKTLIKNNVPKNQIFIFGRDDFSQNKVEEYKLNGVVKNISTGKYSRVEMLSGDQYLINKGGALGSTLTIKGEKDRNSTFINFQGFGTNSFNGVGMSFSAGKVIPFDYNYGLLYLKIFTEQ